MKTTTKLGLGLMAAALLCAACKGDGAAPAANGSATATATAAAVDPFALAVGKDIVASSAPNSFTEGKVTAIEGSKVTYEFGEPDKTTNKRPTSTVDKGKAFVLGAPNKAAPKVGDFIIAKTSTNYWTGCEVKTADGGVLGCEDWYGKIQNVDPKTAIVPDPVTAADIKGSLAKAAKYRAFEAAAKAAGKPLQPNGWKPKVKEAVVVSFVGTSWYGGTVEKLDGDKVVIKWDGTAWKDTPTKMLNELAPLPKGPQTVKEGDFVIVQPKFNGSAWEYRKVVSVAKDTAEVLDRDDQKTTVNLKEVLPIVP